MKRWHKVSLFVIAAMAAGGWIMWGGPPTWKAAQAEIGDLDKYVFVLSRAAPELTLIDTATDRVAMVLKLDRVADQMIVSEAAGRLVFSDVDGKSVALYDPRAGRVEARIGLHMAPRQMVLSPDGWLLAATDMKAGKVAVISLHRKVLLAEIGGFERPYNLTFDVGSTLIYVSDRGTGMVSTIDAAQGKVIGAVKVVDGATGGGGHHISALTRTPNGRLGFCAYRDGHELAVIDLGNDRKIKKLALGREPSRPWGTADGRFMLVANDGDRTISVIDTQALEVIATLPGARDITAINTGWFESVAFAISRRENKAVVLDLMKLKKVGEIPLVSNPGRGVVTHDGKKLYVALGGTNQVAVIDTRARRLTKLIRHVGHEPWGATMARSNNYCH